MHLSSYHAAPVDPLRVAQAEARAAQAACSRAEQELQEMKEAYRQAGDREHVLETKVAQLERQLKLRTSERDHLLTVNKRLTVEAYGEHWEVPD